MTARGSDMNAPLVLIAAGGTGGHVYPALAVADELLQRGYRVEWVGTRRGLENRVVPEAGITLHTLPVRGLRGKSVLYKLRAAIVLVMAVVRALCLLLRRRPACVVGLGGFASGPAGVAAWLLRKPLVIHEQNALAGTTNRMLQRFAKRILAGFPGAFGPGVDYEVPGNPLRRELVDAAANLHYDYDGQRPLNLLVLGGSLGAAPINDSMPGMVRRLMRDGGAGFAIRHQTGELHIDVVRERYGDLLGPTVRVEPFIEDMAEAYAWADLVLCRAGALTISELALMGRPSILVPLPHAIDDHQTLNARTLSTHGAAVIILQNQMDAYKLCTLLRDFMADPGKLRAMAAAAAAQATPHAAEHVADCCEALINA
ncbi:MAG: undecaprenyldiphospho-muramoylpentapeptide beta-N-acetylglucosaminyltransferase [Halioglobus sp.]